MLITKKNQPHSYSLCSGCQYYVFTVCDNNEVIVNCS